MIAYLILTFIYLCNVFDDDGMLICPMATPAPLIAAPALLTAFLAALEELVLQVIEPNVEGGGGGGGTRRRKEEEERG